MIKDVILYGPVDYYTGFGRLTCHLIQQLVRRKIGVMVFTTNNLDRRIELPVEVESVLKSQVGCGTSLLICQFPDLDARVKRGDTVLTMCESTRVDPAGVEALNALAKAVIVPSVWCAVVLSANGVIVPIKVVPLGVDTSIFKPRHSITAGEIKFGASGRLYYSGKRKGIEDVIAAFKLAFPEEKNVRLSLKLFSDCIQPKIDDDRISIIDSELTDEQMAAWYQSLSCFVSASKCEGWGLQVHEAIMCDVPVIAPAYSGLAELVGKGIDFELVDATEGCYSGHWCQLNIETLAARMRMVYSNQEFGLALPIVKTYTTERFADNILKALNS